MSAKGGNSYSRAERLANGLDASIVIGGVYGRSNTINTVITVEIRVRPNAKANRVGGVVGEPPRLVVAVQAPAVDGKANEAVAKVLAKAFDLRARDISIVHGELARDKRVVLEGDATLLTARLIELQGTLL
jgi:uncharacterized protein (TIGR00251 family)